MASFSLLNTILRMIIWISMLIQIDTASSTNDFNTYIRIVNDTSSSFLHSAVTSENVPKIEEKVMTTEYAWAIINYTYKNDNNELDHYSGKAGRYGEGKVSNATGYLIHISSESNKTDDKACNTNLRGTNGSQLPSKDIPWIALIMRGVCTFEDKVKNVYGLGAIGAIIYDNKYSNYIEKMHITDTDRDIAAVMIYKKVGNEMVKLADKGYDVLVSITTGPREKRMISTLNKTSVLFVSVSFIVLMIISLVWLVVYYIQRFRYLQSKDLQSRNLCTMAKKVIMKIPTRSGKHDDKDNENDCCAICIESYKSSDTVRILPCKHEFHKNCIDPWLIEHRTCPMCKLDVLKYYGFVVGENNQIEINQPIVQLDVPASNSSSSSSAIRVDHIHNNTIIDNEIRDNSNQNFLNVIVITNNAINRDSSISVNNNRQLENPSEINTTVNNASTNNVNVTSSRQVTDV